MADLSSILGGMVQGFKDFGTGLVDFFGTGAANIGDIASSIATGRATTKNQDDFRKWLYQTDDKQDAAAKGLGTILNGVSTVADVMPGAQAVTANPLFNGLQGAIGGVSDELKMAGKDADWGRAAQRAGVGAASGLASAYAGQGLAKTGNKLLSNGLTRGAVSGALGGGIANAGYTGIEGGSVQDMINAGLYGAQTGALVGGTTGLARELIKPTHKMDVALTDDEKAARIANIDDQLGKLDTTTPEGSARYAELTAARENYEPKTYYHGSPETDITEFDINRAGKNTRSGEKAIYFTDTPEAAEEFAYERIPTDSIFVDKVGKRGGVYEANLDMRNTLDLDNLTDAQIRELWNYASPLGQLDGQEAFVQRLTDWRDKYHNPQLTKGYIDLEALRNSPYDSFSATMYPNTDNKAKEYAIFDATKAKITKSPKTVADLMLSPDDDVMYSKVAEGQLGLFDQPIAEAEVVDAVNSKNPYAPVDGKVTKAMRDRYNELMTSANGFNQITDNELYNKIDRSTLPKGYDKLQQLLDNQMGENNKVAAELKKGIGTDMPLQADLEKLADYVYGDEINGKNTFLKDLDDSIRLNRKNAEFVGIDAEQAEADARSHAKQKLVSKAMEKAERKVIDDIVGTGDSDDILYALQNYRRRGIRTGRAGALDTALSERLGIAPGNTVKITDVTSDDHLKSGSLGRYARNARDIALSDINSPEGKISTMAHERLHSFQNEARPESAGRYSPEVAEAYRELQKDLGHHYKSHAEIRKHWKKNVDYYANSGEQESRMFQQYLENKGYTDNSAYRGLMNQSGEWGNEINPAFDKFINKLRALSKKGVALPALTALFGGGAIAGALTSGKDDKKKKSEVK